ncbi:unnamed protein product [marine sediment metagenome]|uniref:Uncharacterized protein n=1 Tax=marine sediment metagenome TaxID=412755 RepID=X1C0F8_9ZZZZ
MIEIYRIAVSLTIKSYNFFNIDILFEMKDRCPWFDNQKNGKDGNSKQYQEQDDSGKFIQ